MDFYGKAGEAMAKISVVMPVWNAAATLEASVRSVFGQSLTDWELILVDDGATDGSAALCDRLAAEDSRVRVIHQENAGVSCARNAGIDAANGALLSFLDADDRYHPDFLKTLEGLLAGSGCACAACGDLLCDPDGRTQSEAPPLPAGVYTADQARSGIAVPLLSDRLRRNPVNGYVWRYLFRMETVKDAGLRFFGAYLEDELFLIEYFARGASLAVTDAPLYEYVQNPQSVTRRYLAGYNETFFRSFRLKEQLVERYALAVPDDWRDNCCWAGLLIAVGNEFAPGNSASLSQKRKNVRAMCGRAEYAHAVASYRPPADMPRSKAVVAALLRGKHYALLSLLYAIKNRNRG